MSEPDNASTWPSAMIPPDDPKRQFTIADPDGPRARHVSVSGGTYTILVTGGDSAGRYCLIDMLVPAGSGPPPHRHDFEEMFTLLEGELEFTVRGLHIVNPSQNNVVALKRRKNHSGIVLLKTSMANDEHVARLKKGVDAWNAWRDENPDIRPDLSGANLRGAKLSGANLRGADLSRHHHSHEGHR